MAWLDSDSDYFSDLTLSGSNEDRFALHLAAAQGSITKYLGRELALTEHDEICTPIGGELILRNFPVVSVARLLADQSPALTVENTSAQVASYAVTSTGVSLVHIASGTRTNTSLPYASNVTIGAMGTAIDAVSGWDATAEAYGSFPSSDLVAGQFGSAKYAARLRMWREDSTSYEVDLPTGIMRGNFGTAPVRVIYTAGFSSVPEEILEIVAGLARNGFGGNAAVQSESLGGYSYSIATASEMMQRLGTNAKSTLNRYRDMRA